MTISDREVVAALEHALIQRIGEPRYTLWFQQHTRFSWENGTLHVGVPNRHFQEWLEKTFAAEVRSAASAVLGQTAAVRFVIDPHLFQQARQEQARVQQRTGPGTPLEAADPPAPQPQLKAEAAPPAPPAAPRQQAESRSARRRWRRLNDFVVGPCNRVAHASALSVVEAPGEGANPLVLHGPVGTGKTHLLEGIYVGLRKAQASWRISFITAEEFTNRFLHAMHVGKLSTFRKQFRETDALLVDDLHFLATKRATQEEFLHTFDVLQSEGKQLVVTCDCHPRLTEEFSPELTDRLLGGAVWGLTPPDAETRLNLLRRKSLQAGEAPLTEEVLQYVAAQLRGNVRELEGALQSVRHYSRVVSRPADLNLAREALADLLRHAVRVVQLGDVDQAVCRALRLETGALQAKQRSWAVSHPRMLAMYLARKHTAAAYSDVGRHFGGRNHSTAVAAEKKVRHWLQENGELQLGERRLKVREVVELIERELLR